MQQNGGKAKAKFRARTSRTLLLKHNKRQYLATNQGGSQDDAANAQRATTHASAQASKGHCQSEMQTEFLVFLAVGDIHPEWTGRAAPAPTHAVAKL